MPDNPEWQHGSADIAVSSAAANIIVAGIPSRRIAVFSFVLQGLGTVTAKFTDGAGGANLTGAFSFQDREGLVVSGTRPPVFLFATTVNTALVLYLSGAVGVVGFVSYMVL